MKTIHPQIAQVYTALQIFDELKLLGKPQLEFVYQDKKGVVQLHHIRTGDLLSIPGMEDTEWKYLYLSEESMELFRYEGPMTDLLNVVSIELFFNPNLNADDLKTWWVTPRGFPLKQPFMEE